MCKGPVVGGSREQGLWDQLAGPVGGMGYPEGFGRTRLVLEEITRAEGRGGQ